MDRIRPNCSRFNVGGATGFNDWFAVAGVVFAIGLVIAGLAGWTPEEVSARFKTSGIRSAAWHFAKCVLFFAG